MSTSVTPLNTDLTSCRHIPTGNHFHPYQLEAIGFLATKNKGALFFDCGLGKTAITLTAFNVLHRNLEAHKMLVVAPLRVVLTVWAQEAAQWTHLRGLRFSTIHGTPAQRLEALQASADVWLINYENLVWLAEYEKSWPDWDVIVFDELTRMKGGNKAKRFKVFRNRKLFKKFDYRWGLTGTPAPNGYEDLWAQMFCLDDGSRLGAYVSHYRSRYFTPSGYKGYKWEVKPWSKIQIEKKIQDITLRMSLEDAGLGLQDPQHINIYCEMDDRLRKKYKKLEDELFYELGGDSDGIEVFNAAALSNKCHQFAQGAMYGDPDEDGRKEWHEVHKLKLDALDSILSELAGHPALVLYTFRHDSERVSQHLGGVPDLGRLKGADVEGMVASWNRGEVPVLLGHPASIGHGLNLQHGSHCVILIGHTWSLEDYEQAISRIARQGQKKQVFIYHIITKGTVDEAVVKALSKKARTQNALLEALREYRIAKHGKR